MGANLYNLGDLVYTEYHEIWYKIIEIEINSFVSAIEEEESKTDVIYTVKSIDGLIRQVFEEDIVFVKKQVQPVKNHRNKSKKIQIDELLDQMNSLKEINLVTLGAFDEEYERVVEELKKLTQK